MNSVIGFVVHSHTHTHRIRSDHNQDNTTAILREWTEKAQHLYSSIDLQISEEWLYPNYYPFDMPDERYEQVARLRQKGLEAARSSGADYLFVSCNSPPSPDLCVYSRYLLHVL